MAGRSQVVLEFIGDDSRLQKTLKKVQAQTSGVLGAIGKLGRVSGGAAAFMGMANAGQTLYGALSLVAPAALALPGLLAGGIVAAQTAKLAFAGFGDALSGDAEALAKLPPEMRAAVSATKALETGFSGMRAAVQQEFWRGLAPEISKTGTELLKLGTVQLPKVAAGFNGMAKEALAAARTPVFQNDLTEIIGNTAAALGNMRGVLANVLSGLVGLGGVGVTYLPAIAGWIDKIAAGFKRWVDQGVESGSIEGMINVALDGFRQIWDLLKAVGSVAATAWGGLQQGLGSAVSPLETLVEHVRAFQSALATPESQAALAKIGAMVRALSDAFLAVLPHVVEIASAIASILAPAVTEVADVVADNGGLFAGLIAGGGIAGAAIGVVQGAVEGVTGVIETAQAAQEAWNFVTGLFARQGAIVRAATMAWTGAQWLLNAALNANPIGLIVIAIAALVAGLIWAYNNSETFRDIVNGAFHAVGAVVGAVVDFLVGVWNDLVAFFTGAPSTIGAALTAIGEWFMSLPGVIGGALLAAITAVGDFLAQLPGMIAYALGYLAGLVFTGAKAAWDFLWNTLPGILVQVGTWLLGLPGQVIGWLSGLATTVAGLAVDAWTSFKNWSIQLLTDFLNWLSGVPGAVGNFLASLPGIVGNAATTAWTNFKNWTVSTATAALNWIRGVPGQVMGFFSNAGSWLVNAGKQILEGLWNGLKSIAQGVLNWIADIGRQIAAGFAAAVGIASPSKVFMEHGVNIGAGLIQGLKNITPAVVGSTVAMADQVGAAPMPSLAPTLPTPAASAGGPVTVHFTGNTSDALATVIMQMIRTGKIQLKAA